jgi:hypothetical protein
MMTTGQRANVHGIIEASREWQRIVELAFRRGLAELPASRPEFAPESQPRAEVQSDPLAAAS